MTDIRKSDAQLDAEAAAPEDRDLDAAIRAHRLMFRAEVGILRLHQRDGESGIGPPFSPPFENFLDERYGLFPWSSALLFLRYRVCRGTHPEHLRTEWGHGLCYELVTRVIRLDYSLDQARLQLGLANEGRSRRTLSSALLSIERRLEAGDRPDPQPRTPAEWMAPIHTHRSLPGLHSQECQNPVCRRAAA